MVRVGSLFSGIGGLDLGLERAGMEIAWQVEIDDYCRRVLAKHWPDVPRYGDIREVNLEQLERVDLICGGFPCQPVSSAGRRRVQDDPRWLWPEYQRVLGHLRPGFALVENVSGLLVRGMASVLGDLAALGFDAEWQTFPAAAVGANHRRARVWLLAYSSSAEWRATQPQSVAPAGWGAREPRECLSGQVPRTDWWRTEPDVGRVAHGVPARVDRLRGLGNAVVPQVAEWIGTQLLAAIGTESARA